MVIPPLNQYYCEKNVALIKLFSSSKQVYAVVYCINYGLL